MKILSWNVNGLRSIYKKNFSAWLARSGADIVCLQEIKAGMDQVPPELVDPRGYYSYFNPAERKGYSGTAIFSKAKPLRIGRKLGFKRFDSEGRILKAEFLDFILVNLYLPHGGRQKENLKYKLEVYDRLLAYLKKVKNKRIILIGDFNVAHEDIDLARPKHNRNNIMFTPGERKQIDRLIDLGFTDTFRRFHGEGGHYTWWPYFANARSRNLGWRIDYAFVSRPLASKLENASISSRVKGSDHCPIGLGIGRGLD